MTQDELMQMASEAGMEPSATAVKALSTTVPIEWLEQFANAILERAAVELDAKQSRELAKTYVTAYGKSAATIRALKINTGE